MSQLTSLSGAMRQLFGVQDEEQEAQEARLGRELVGEQLAGFRRRIRFADDGDPEASHATAKARKNYAVTSPVTRQSGKKKTVLARDVCNDRLADALHRQAQSALIASPGARAYYDEQRDRGLDHDAALRALSNRLVGILHGCLKTGTVYDEATAWSHRDMISGAA